MTIRKELKEGINGSGHKVWVVFSINTETNSCIHNEYFDTEAEAKNWIKYT